MKFKSFSIVSVLCILSLCVSSLSYASDPASIPEDPVIESFDAPAESGSALLSPDEFTDTPEMTEDDSAGYEPDDTAYDAGDESADPAYESGGESVDPAYESDDAAPAYDEEVSEAPSEDASAEEVNAEPSDSSEDISPESAGGELPDSSSVFEDIPAEETSDSGASAAELTDSAEFTDSAAELTDSTVEFTDSTAEFTDSAVESAAMAELTDSEAEPLPVTDNELMVWESPNSSSILDEWSKRARLAVSVSCVDDSMLTYTWADQYGTLDGGFSYYYVAQRTGVYTCTVTDGYGGEASVSFTVRNAEDFGVEVEFADGDPTWAELTCPVGGSVVLKADTSYAEAATGFSFEWRNADTGARLSGSGRSITVSPEKNTLYSCCVSLGYRAQMLYFDVSIGNQLKAYDKTEKSDQVYLAKTPGSSFTLTAAYSASDTSGVTMRWVDTGSHRTVSEGSVSLAISGFEKAASYTFCVTDRFGNSAYAYYTIDVENHLKFSAPIVNKTVCKGMSVTFNPGFYADKTAGTVFVWYDENHVVLQKGTTKPYSITATASRAYICEATDVYGNSVSIIYYLKVLTSHNYGSWTTTKAATVFATGSRYRTCTICGAKQTQTIAKLTPFIKFNKTAFSLARKKSTTVTVTLAKGDSIVKVAPTWTSRVSATYKGLTITVTAKTAKGKTTVAVKTKTGKVKKFTVTVT